MHGRGLSAWQYCSAARTQQMTALLATRLRDFNLTPAPILLHDTGFGSGGPTLLSALCSHAFVAGRCAAFAASEHEVRAFVHTQTSPMKRKGTCFMP